MKSRKMQSCKRHVNAVTISLEHSQQKMDRLPDRGEIVATSGLHSKAENKRAKSPEISRPKKVKSCVESALRD